MKKCGKLGYKKKLGAQITPPSPLLILILFPISSPCGGLTLQGPIQTSFLYLFYKFGGVFLIVPIYDIPSEMQF